MAGRLLAAIPYAAILFSEPIDDKRNNRGVPRQRGKNMTTEFHERLEAAYQLFARCPDPQAKAAEGGWSVKEILGHLVDSAGNNFQRLQRYVPGGELRFPEYDQEESVRRANYRHFEFRALLSLWYDYNKLLLHLYANIPQADRESMIKVGDNAAVSIRQLMADYFSHMALHEKQAERIIAAGP
jgi:hypothetical protein